MGGYGSGRRWGSSKDTTSSYLRLDVRWLGRKGFLVPGRSSNVTWSRNGEPAGNINLQCETDRVVLCYSHRRFDEPWKNEKYPVPLERTPCHYGGKRVWFRCPARGCGRRVAILYGSGIFACRNCYQLAYESQHEAPHNRALTRAQSIREKLGGSGSMGEPFPWKPKGMHWSTYWRLRQTAEEAGARSAPPWLLKRLGSGVV